jgi:hypothetical protein
LLYFRQAFKAIMMHMWIMATANYLQLQRNSER